MQRANCNDKNLNIQSNFSVGQMTDFQCQFVHWNSRDFLCRKTGLAPYTTSIAHWAKYLLLKCSTAFLLIMKIHNLNMGKLSKIFKQIIGTISTFWNVYIVYLECLYMNSRGEKSMFYLSLCQFLFFDFLKFNVPVCTFI